MKKLLVGALLTMSFIASANEFTKYEVAESMFPNMIEVGSVIELSADKLTLRMDLEGDVADLECEIAPAEVVEEYKEINAEVSSIIACGEETTIILTKDDSELNYNGIALADRK